MAGKITEPAFKKQKKLLIVINVAIFLYIIFCYPQGFGFWGFKGVNVYAAFIIMPSVAKIFLIDYWKQNKFEIETEIFKWWLVTGASLLLVLIMSPFFFIFAKSAQTIA